MIASLLYICFDFPSCLINYKFVKCFTKHYTTVIISESKIFDRHSENQFGWLNKLHGICQKWTEYLLCMLIKIRKLVGLSTLLSKEQRGSTWKIIYFFFENRSFVNIILEHLVLKSL